MGDTMALFGFANKLQDPAYVVFRIGFGILFALHGMQKLGWIGGRDAMQGLMLIVGIGEFLVGLALVAGLLTRISAIGGMVIMVGALIMSHWPKGFLPLGNGEAAWLYLIAFIFIFTMDAGKCSLEKLLWKKELF